MPFRSEKQRRFLWAAHPDIAKRWAHEYPQKKKLPLYAHEDGKDKAKDPDTSKQPDSDTSKAADATMANTNKQLDTLSAVGTRIYNKLNKKADSAVFKLNIPRSEKPVAAGDESISVRKTDTNLHGASSCENKGDAHVSPLMAKLSVVLSQKIQQAIADDEAAQAGAEAQQVPQNAGLKNYPAGAPVPPPMGSAPTAPPASQAPDPNAQAQGTMPPVGDGSNPSANPINSYGGLSVNGDINGNAAFGAPGGSKTAGKLGLWDRIRAKKERGEKPAKPGDKDYPDAKSWKKVTSISEKKSAEDKACSCGCGDTVKTCKCGPDCKCRKPGGSCHKGEKSAGLSGLIGKLFSGGTRAATGAATSAVKAAPRLSLETANAAVAPALASARGVALPNNANLLSGVFNRAGNLPTPRPPHMRPMAARSDAGGLRRFGDNIGGMTPEQKTQMGSAWDRWHQVMQSRATEAGTPMRPQSNPFTADDFWGALGSTKQSASSPARQRAAGSDDAEDMRSLKHRQEAYKKAPAWKKVIFGRDLLSKTPYLEDGVDAEKQSGTPAWQRAAGKNSPDSLKTAATSLRSAFRVVSEPATHGADRMWRAFVGNVPAGLLATKTDAVSGLPQIVRSEIFDKFRGMGLGKKMYMDVARHAGRGGLLSDTEVAPAAQRVWQSLQRRGRGVALGSGVVMGPANQARIPANELARQFANPNAVAPSLYKMTVPPKITKAWGQNLTAGGAMKLSASAVLEKLAAAGGAWTRSEGKNPEGGLNEKGRKSYEREHGGNLKAPVTESNPKGERAKRQNSFCSRMCGMKSKNTGAEAKKDPDSRINKSLRKWNCKCSSAMEFGIKMAARGDMAQKLFAQLAKAQEFAKNTTGETATWGGKAFRNLQTRDHLSYGPAGAHYQLFKLFGRPGSAAVPTPVIPDRGTDAAKSVADIVSSARNLAFRVPEPRRGIYNPEDVSGRLYKLMSKKSAATGEELGGSLGGLAGGNAGLFGGLAAAQYLDNPANIDALKFTHGLNHAKHTALGAAGKALGMPRPLNERLSHLGSKAVLKALQYLPKSKLGRGAMAVGLPLAGVLGVGLPARAIGGTVGRQFDTPAGK